MVDYQFFNEKMKFMSKPFPTVTLITEIHKFFPLNIISR